MAAAAATAARAAPVACTSALPLAPPASPLRSETVRARRPSRGRNSRITAAIIGSHSDLAGVVANGSLGGDSNNAAGSCVRPAAVPPLGFADGGSTSSMAAGVVLLATLGALAAAGPAAAEGTAAHVQHTAVVLADVAEGEEFWGNVAKYGRYFVTVMLGTGYSMLQPLFGALKRPTSAVITLLALGGGAVLLKLTLDAMLGIAEPFAYEPGNIVPYN